MLNGNPVPGVQVQNLQFFIGEIDGAAAGFSAVEWKSDEGIIHGVVASPDFKRRGVARGLINHVFHEARLRGVQKLKAITAETENPAAMAFFRAHGFEIQGVAGTYPKGQRAVHLCHERISEPYPVDDLCAEVVEPLQNDENEEGCVVVANLAAKEVTATAQSQSSAPTTDGYAVVLQAFSEASDSLVEAWSESIKVQNFELAAIIKKSAEDHISKLMRQIPLLESSRSLPLTNRA